MIRLLVARLLDSTAQVGVDMTRLVAVGCLSNTEQPGLSFLRRPAIASGGRLARALQPEEDGGIHFPPPAC